MRRLAPPPAAEAPALPVARPAAARAAPGGPRRAFVLTTAPGTADPPRLAGPWAVAGWAPLAASGDGALAARLAEARAEVVVVCLAPDAPPALRDRILALAAGPRPLRIVPWAPPLRGGPGPVVRYALPLGRRARQIEHAGLCVGGSGGGPRAHPAGSGQPPGV